ncbi:MAG: hypothetical protein GX639_16980 [Fibrobacter sp.]|nr:hypothetical protein [Fibrobacter sp.]
MQIKELFSRCLNSFQMLSKYQSIARPGVIFYLVTLLVTLVLLMFLILRNYYNGSTTQQYRILESEAKLAATVVDENMDLLIRIGMAYSTRPLLNSYINENSWAEAIMIVRDLLDKEIGIDRIILYDTNGILKADFPDLNVIGGDRSSWQWFKEFKILRKPHLSGIYQRGAKPQQNVLSIALPIMSSDPKPTSSTEITNAHMIGILQLHIDPSLFSKWASIDLGEDGKILIVDQYGKIIHHPQIKSADSIADYSDIEIVKRVLSGENGTAPYFNTKIQRQELASFQRLNQYGWGIIVSQPSSEAFKIRNSTMITLTIICSIIFFGVIILIFNILHTFYIQQKTSEEIRQKNNDLQKMNISLNEAFENIKTLKGMLPICSFCKKIRNDTGYWQQIESYVRDHSDAEFSHGICPSCLREHYPEMADDILNRVKSNDSGEKPSAT